MRSVFYYKGFYQKEFICRNETHEVETAAPTTHEVETAVFKTHEAESAAPKQQIFGYAALKKHVVEIVSSKYNLFKRLFRRAELWYATLNQCFPSFEHCALHRG